MPKMALGLSMRRLGYHIAAWRHPDTRADAGESFDCYVEAAQAAEAAKFDMVFLADGLAVRAVDEPRGSLCRSNENVELEPLTLLAALAPLTHRIGLVATSSTTYNEPFHVARRYASLDRISKGRAGWNVVTSWSEMEALNFSREHHLDRDTRYARAKEFAEVVTGLWDSWEPDAFLRDKAGGLFYDPAKLHVLNHRGAHFQVRGPLTASQSPQGRPVLVQAGSSGDGQELAAAYADVIYTNQYSIETALDYVRLLEPRLAAFGRTRRDIRVLPGIQTFVAATRAEAQAKLDALQALIDPVTGIATLYNLLGDLSGFDVDGPLPEQALRPDITSNGRKTFEMAQREALTIRQLYMRTAGKAGILQLIGTAADIVDQMEAWFTAGACDGFNLCPSHFPHGLNDFVTFVLPELRRRNLFREDYESTTLRGNLGLPPYINVHQRPRDEGKAAAE